MAQMFLTLALVGSFYAVFSIFIRSMFPTDKCKSIYEVANVLENIYVLLLFVILIVSVTRKVEKSGVYYQAAAVVLGLFMLITLTSSIFYFFVRTDQHLSLAFFFVIGTLLSYILPVLLHSRQISFLKFIVGTSALMFLTPTFINVFVVYAISNLHDVSWGNRPSNAGLSKEEQNLKDNYEIFRSKSLLIWLIFNTAFAYSFIYAHRAGNDFFIMAMALYVGAILWLRLVFAIIHKLSTCCVASSLERYIKNPPPVPPRKMPEEPEISGIDDDVITDRKEE